MDTILVIVESASKSKTIQKYLNKNSNVHYKVVASLGHIVDLPPKKLGIDLDTWDLEYQPIPLKGKVIKQLKEDAKHATHVYLASDPDREGEAIAWHLKNILKLENPKRILFHEITEKAIQEAIQSPKEINMDLVNAQESRRALDRVVGFKLSPLLWSRFTASGLSAGRVQSPALKTIVERYKNYESHVAEKFWTIEGTFKILTKDVEMDLISRATKKKEVFSNYDQSLSILTTLKDNDPIEWTVQIEFKIALRNPSAPYTTSALQQEVYDSYGIPAKDTMKHAQALYEMGAITYMRTDSVQLSKDAKHFIKNYVTDRFGKDHHQDRFFKSKVANAQEAHECIRPTNIAFDISKLSPPQKKIYDIIWRKAVSSQMIPAEYMDVHIYATCNLEDLKDYYFYGKVSYVQKLGYLKIWNPKATEEHKEIAAWKKPATISPIKYMSKGQVTKPDGLYNEPMLIKWMEKEGIGRPSTYATIVTKLFEKGYVAKGPNPIKSETIQHAILENKEIQTKDETITFGGTEKDRFIPNSIGIQIVEYLDKYFEHLMDYPFTAHLEDQLDQISRKETSKINLLTDFYKTLDTNMKRVEKERKEYSKANPKPKTKKEVEPNKTNVLKEFPDLDMNLIKTRFGPALYHISTKAFTSVAPFLQWKRKEVEDLSDQDVSFLKSLPIKLNEDTSIQYGRYGLYLMHQQKNHRLDKKYWNAIYNGTYQLTELLQLIDPA